MNPKPDAVIYTTARRTTLATIAIHMQEQGFNPKSMSEMIRMILEIYAEWIKKQGAEPIESTIEADAILTRMFKASLNAGNRYKKNMLQNMQEENEAIESWEIEEFNIKPVKFSKRWTEDDQQRTIERANKELMDNPRLKAILEQNKHAVEGD